MGKWTIPAGARSLVVNGYPLTYSARGAGPIAIFIGGTLTDYRVWNEPLASWESDFRIVAVSLRHHYPERWDGEGADFTVAQHASDLVVLIDHLASGPAFLVGWSYGGHVAYEVARTRPGRVKKLVLVEAPLDPLTGDPDGAATVARNRLAEDVARFLKAGDLDAGLGLAVDAINGAGAWESRPESVRETLRDNAWTIVGVGRERAHAVSREEFAALSMPVLLVKGELTTPRFHRRVEEQSKCLPLANVASIPNSGHRSPMMNPQAFKEAVASFLLA